MVIIVRYLIMKPLSLDHQNSIISLLERGISITQTAKQLGMSISTVSKYKNSHLSHVKTSTGGRVSKLSDRDKARIRRNVLTGTWKTAAEVHANLLQEGYEISHTTICRSLNCMGFEAKVKPNKPLLSNRHRETRYKWAKAHEYWTVDDWKRVIFSDETKINIWGSDGCKFYWSRPNDPLKTHHIDVTVKHGGGSLMMWGCITYAGVGYGCHIEETMDADVYRHILETSFKDTLEYWGLSKQSVIFQHDNDPKHTSKKVKEWFVKEGIQVLAWPAQSPDLNPIEHVWRHLKLKLARYETKAKGIHELWERCDKEWNSFSTEECRKYIESMPARVKAVMATKGGHTKY
jgi:transposase